MEYLDKAINIIFVGPPGIGNYTGQELVDDLAKAKLMGQSPQKSGTFGLADIKHMATNRKV